MSAARACVTDEDAIASHREAESLSTSFIESNFNLLTALRAAALANIVEERQKASVRSAHSTFQSSVAVNVIVQD